MPTDFHRRLREGLAEVRELSGEDRARRLEALGAEDPALRDEVESLLAAAERPASGLQDGALPAMGGLLDLWEDGEATFPGRVGRYRIVRRLAAGGMGVVYEAEQEQPRRTVALKMPRVDVLSAEALRRFRGEVEILGRLTHPGIAQVHDAGTVELDGLTQPFFAMEFIEGSPITEHVEEAGLDTEARLALFVEICDTVDHAHRQGVIHRDIKPDNVLVVDRGDGSRGQPKILDFGVARATDADVQLTTIHTEVGQVLGTVPYMSPEQIAGDPQAVDARTDVYALGVLLFELLADRLPLDLRGKTIAEAARTITDEEPTSLGSVNASYRGDLDTIVAKALEKELHRRYATAAELAADVRRFLAHEPIRARPVTTFYQVRKFARRNKALVGGVASTFVVLVVGTVLATMFALDARAEAERAQRAQYRAQLELARAARAAHDPRSARQHLAAAPEDLRGWEWRHQQAGLADHLWQAPIETVQVSRVAFHPGGERVFAIEGPGRLASRDVVTGEALDLGLPAAWRVMDLAVSATSIAAWGEDGTLRLLDPHTGAEQASWALGGRATSLAWDRAGRRLALALQGAQGDDSTQVDIRIVADWTPTLLGTWTGSGMDLDWARDDGGLLVGTSGFGVRPRWPVMVVDPDAGEAVATFPRPAQALSAAAAASGGLLAVGDDQRYVTLLEPAPDDGEAALRERATLRGHAARFVLDLDLSADGRRLASVASDDAVRIWDTATGTTEHAFVVEGRPRLDLDAEGRRLAVTDAGTLRIFDLERLGELALEHPTYVYRATFSPDGRTLATIDFDGWVRLFDVADGRSWGEPRWRVYSSGAFAFSRDGSTLFSLGHRPERFDVFTGIDPEVVELARREPLTADGEVDPAEAARRRWSALAGEPRPTRRLAIDRERGLFLHAGWPVLLDLDSGERLVELSGLGSGPATPTDPGRDHSAAFSPDGDRVVLARHGATVHDVATGERQALLGHLGEVYAVAWSPDGSRIATGGEGAVIRLWNAETYEQVQELRGHEAYVYDLEWSPDGTLLASASGDGTVRLWDSVPRATRHAQALEAARWREALRPRVEALFEEHGEAAAVAEALRRAADLDDDRRHAALRVVRERVDAEAP